MLSILVFLDFYLLARVFGLIAYRWLSIPLFIFCALLAPRILKKIAWDSGLGNVSSLLELILAFLAMF